MTNVLWFIWSMILSYLPGITGWIYSPRAGEAAWYGTLTQSALTPAPWVFAVAWSILYFLLGCALYLIIRDRRSGQSKFGAYVLFGVHMVLNALWTYWFFGFIWRAWRAGWRGKFGLLLALIAFFMFIRIFMGDSCVQKFVINIWELNTEQQRLTMEQEKLTTLKQHIDLLQGYSADYVQELGLRYLNMGDPDIRILKY